MVMVYFVFESQEAKSVATLTLQKNKHNFSVALR